MLALLLGLMCNTAGAVEVTTVSAPPTIDGVLDEPEWAQAEVVRDFQRFIPTDGGAPPGTTEVRFLQDDKYLYVGVEVSDATYPIRARISPREDINADDQIGIYFDTFRDQTTGYIFYLNGRGIQQDIRIGPGGGNFTWGTLWYSEGKVHDDGYTLEIAFPFRSFKYPSQDGEQTWGLLLTRKIPSEGAKYGWPRQVRNPTRLFAQAGPLTGIKPREQGSGLELIPTVTGVQEWSRKNRNDPNMDWGGVEPALETVRPSLDARYGITPNIAAIGTANPDFSQVEIDVTPIALNQRFAFFFQERRPFFMEGSGFFANPQSTLYTRSIVEPIYGAKIIGQEGNVAIGALQSIDRSPGATVNENGAPGFDEASVEGRQAANLMARMRAVTWEKGHIGFTIADKRLVGLDGDTEATGLFEEVGTDFEAPLGGRWFLAGAHAHSWTDDRRDPVPALWGTDTSASIRRQTGQGTGFSVGVSDRSPGFRRELGFLTQSGIFGASTSLDHTFEPEGGIDYWVPGVAVSANQERNGDYVRSISHSQNMVLRGLHEFDGAVAVRQQTDNGVTLDLWDTSLGYQAQLSERVSVQPAFSRSRVIDYSRLVPADFGSGSFYTKLRPTVGTQFDLTLQGQTLVPEGHDRQLAQLERLRWTWQFTRPFGSRLIVEHTDGTERDPLLISSLLFTWLAHPGTAAYIGYGETTDLKHGPVPLSRSVFAKASVLLRP